MNDIIKNELIELVKNKYNEIFSEHNNIDGYDLWFNNYFGEFGAQSINIVDNNFIINIVVNSEFKEIIITFEEMIERIYLYSKYEIEGSLMLSFNGCDLVPNMKPSNTSDGEYIVINDNNREEIQNA